LRWKKFWGIPFLYIGLHAQLVTGGISEMLFSIYIILKRRTPSRSEQDGEIKKMIKIQKYIV
jgi:hypothetical protein